MTELSGTLEGVGLPAIVRFLSGLKKTGCLRIVHHDWRGDVYFDMGQVIGATLGSRHGLSALDALVQVLPGGTFTFEGGSRLAGEATISLSPEALQAHLDELAEQIAGGTSRLPSLDVVPTVLAQDNSSSGEEPLPLDRGTLQTLLAVDGRRTVREIIGQRGSLDALWHLASLAEVGLIQLGSNVEQSAPSLDAAAAPVEAPSPPTSHDVAAPVQLPVSSSNEVAAPVEPAETREASSEAGPLPMTWNAAAAPEESAAPPLVDTMAFEPERSAPVPPRPIAIEPPVAEAITHCPKLGFEDDSSNSFGRPTRLHRCFAAGTPLPLSLDQQRELCLSEQYPTCPRLTMGGFVPPARDPQPGEILPAVRGTQPDQLVPPARDGQPGGSVPTGRDTQPTPGGPLGRRPSIRRPEPEAEEDQRIVRLPFPARASLTERGAVADRQAVGGTEPTRFRTAGSPLRDRPSVPPSPGTPTTSPAPTPLRARLERATPVTAETAEVESPERPRPEPLVSETKSAGQALADLSGNRRLAGIPIVFIAGGAVLLVVLALLAFVVTPYLGDLFAGDTLDTTALPNSSAVAAGTPISELNLARATAVARATAGAATNAGTPASDTSTTNDATTAGTANSAPSTASASTAPPVPTLLPEAAPTAAQPALAQPPAAGAAAAGPAGAAQPAAGTLLDERFANNDRNWPSSAQGTALVTNGSYRLAPRQAGQFVAIGAPIVDALQDVVVNATFHKLNGPLGGGYGIIVRDQAATPQNGTSQDGHYYVLEVGDKGEVGMWRRDGSQWVDLLPWQANPAVKTDTASNDVTVRAQGNRLTMTVNGVLVAAKTDDAFASGGVGLFVGGDGNQVAVDRLSIQTP